MTLSTRMQIATLLGKRTRVAQTSLGLAAAVGVLGVGLRLVAPRPGRAPSDDDPAHAQAVTSEQPSEHVVRQDRSQLLHVRGLSSNDIARYVENGLAEAHAAVADGTFDKAVEHFEDVLRLDPDNRDARAHIGPAREAARLLAPVRSAFATEDYGSALWYLYRLPDSFDPNLADRFKARGWYNLGLVALRAGRFDDARTHLRDALTIRPRDPDTMAALAVAERCRAQPNRLTCRIAVESIPLQTQNAMEVSR